MAITKGALTRSIKETFVRLTLLLFVLCVVGCSKKTALNESSEIAAWNELGAMTTAMELYFMDCDCYPSGKGERAAVGFNALVKNVENKDNWAGPYIRYRRDVDGDNLPDDPWGNEYEYEAATSNAQEYTIWCRGVRGDYKAYQVNPGPFRRHVTSES